MRYLTNYLTKFVLLLVCVALPMVASAGSVYYIHTDHLGAPKAVTDDAKEVVWQGRYDAFGKVTEEVAQLEMNLRYPGQYLDRETGLHYNWHRYYDPELGRYVTSDPIGLDGGLSTYGYVGGNPLLWIDPWGLDRTPGAMYQAAGFSRMVPPDNRSIDQIDEGQKSLTTAFSLVAGLGSAVPRLLTGNLIGGTICLTTTKGGGDLVDLYRAVGPDELADIERTGKLINRGSAEGKYFTSSSEHASDYARQAVKAFGDPAYTTVRTQVPRSSMPSPESVDGGIPAYVLPNKSLQGLKPEVLNSMSVPGAR